MTTQHQSNQKKVLIIGGGIGGLTAGIALKRLGFHPIVFERAPEIRPLGAGISLWSNAVKALGLLGIDRAIIDKASIIRRGRVMTTRGKPIATTDVNAISQKVGAPSIMIHRADLQNELVDELGRENLILNAELERFEESNGQVTAYFKDGSAATGSLLIGADGIHSQVRRQLFGETPIRYSGVTAWRGIADIESAKFERDTSTLAIGPGFQMGVFPCGPGRVYWFVAKSAAPNGKESANGNKHDVRQHLRGFAPSLTEVVDATEPDKVIRNDLGDRAPIWPWGKGRVTLLGDAIHPMTPNMGQGGCQAIEDAIYLAYSLGGHRNLTDCLRDYENQRRERTTCAVKQSRFAGEIFKIKNELLVTARNWFMSTSWGKRKSESILSTMVDTELPRIDLLINQLERAESF